MTRLMLDTNIFDALAADPEAVAELENRRDLRLVVSEVQLRQLAAIPDVERSSLYLELAKRLCGTVSAFLARKPDIPSVADTADHDRHEPDRMIAAAARSRCDMLITNDRGLLEYARQASIVAMDWKTFLRCILFHTG
ncbi:MAG TPA: hypothetical protein VMX33_04460 [bacterium]|nr:hypothetical protein [bacterium]